MAKKTWKIGEYARGGVIKADIYGGIVKISCHDYFTDETLFEFSSDRYHDLQEELEDWTSVGWADIIMKWIDSKTKLVYGRY